MFIVPKKEEKWIGLSPHPFNFFDEAGTTLILTVEQGGLARKGAEDIPPPQDGVRYIVSWPVKRQLPYRKDVGAPARFVMLDNGQIIGARGVII